MRPEDYAIKVRNLQEADKLELVRQEREKQIRLAESFLANVIDKRWKKAYNTNPRNSI